MTPTEVRFEKCVNDGNFGHVKGAITIRIDAGDTADEVFEEARNLVDQLLAVKVPPPTTQDDGIPF